MRPGGFPPRHRRRRAPNLLGVARRRGSQPVSTDRGSRFPRRHRPAAVSAVGDARAAACRAGLFFFQRMLCSGAESASGHAFSRPRGAPRHPDARPDAQGRPVERRLRSPVRGSRRRATVTGDSPAGHHRLGSFAGEPAKARNPRQTPGEGVFESPRILARPPASHRRRCRRRRAGTPGRRAASPARRRRPRLAICRRNRAGER